VASVAVWLVAKGNKVEEARIAFGGVASTPIRARMAEESLAGLKLDEQLIEKIARQAQAEIDPISDVRASAEYRRAVSSRLLAKALRGALGMEG
jgi:CO/xanthine dehydrogenase FAD-binding subunit